MDKVLLYFSLKYEGDWDKIYKALENKEKISHTSLENVVNQIDSDYITILSHLYPQNLKATYKPPFVLFYKGNIENLAQYNHTFGVVGGSRFDDHGYQIAKKFLKEFNHRQRVVVTYDNDGLNKELINYCRAENYKNIFILKGGMHTYLTKYQEIILTSNELVLSELYNESKIDGAQYVNRLMSALSRGLLFVQYGSGDNFNNLINFSLNEGKEIFAVPSLDSSFNQTNQLIRSGAKLTESIDDIINEF